MSRRLLQLLTVAGACALLAPAAALADAPWSAPVAQPGQLSSATATPNGAVVTLVGANRSQPPNTAALLARLDPVSGAATSSTGVDLGGGLVAGYARNAIAVAGTSIGPSGTIDTASRVRVGTTSASGGTPVLHTLSGTQGQNVSALVGNLRGDVALATRGGTSHGQSRMIYLRRAGTSTFTRILTIPVSSQGRDVTVAVGPSGDVLVVWEDRHVVMARHRGAHGTWGAAHKLGPGVQSHLQAAVDQTGRLMAAWASQRVGEGEAATSPAVRFVTAAPGHGFGAVRTLELSTATNGNVAVAGPAVRLVVTGPSRALLAWTSFDGTTFAVQARTIAAGHLGTTQTVSPAGTDAVLGDVAVAPPATGSVDGPTVVTWLSGLHGSTTPAGTAARVFAAVRGTGMTDFDGAEAVSEPGSDVPFAPAALVVPGSARAFAFFAHLRSDAPPLGEAAVRAPITP
jgi:hypothetical protein